MTRVGRARDLVSTVGMPMLEPGFARRARAQNQVVKPSMNSM